MTIAEFLTKAAESLRQNEIPEFRREASSLLSFVLNKNKAFLIAHPEYRLTTEEAASFESVVRRRAGREPYQYIVGRQEFYGLDFEVTQGVLIPRPETEILVEAAIGLLAGIKNPIFYEIGVGSGCISVSILAKVKDSRAVGVDISDNALALSKKTHKLTTSPPV